ncbi:hypothetical protein FOYG_17113 [Fusarium oxysporum NRRL 32931]|uniref:Copper transport protein n=1 Tax=Fusarium oxysporum NRRL 32931 TaxID=660029 RepID=W9HAY7_FUSOX|nr:hypothetical protein FOYG_17113 [Fusarium oxysporum NRRL 32931]
MFSTGTGTPLYSSAWIPISVDNYAGTCLFLIAIGVILQSLGAVKSVLARRGVDAELNTRYVVFKKKANSDLESSKGVLTETGLETDVILVRRSMEGARPWRITIDGPRAAVDTVIAGLLYLTMLSIMPMNMGYFLCVLGGIFLGSLAVGRYGGWTPGDTSLHG